MIRRTYLAGVPAAGFPRLFALCLGWLAVLTVVAWPSHLVAQEPVQKLAPWDSTPLIKVSDIDSTTLPCDDFYQYATGGWYRRMPTAITDSVEVVGPDLRRIGAALRQYVEAAPALVPTTTDPVTRLLGDFYGSCLADATGTAKGRVGDTARANYCFQATQETLDLALSSLLLERVWPAEARAQSRTLWTSMTQAATKRLQASSVLRDATRQRLMGVVASTQLVIDDTSPIPFVPFLDSIAPEWERVSKRAYSKIALSPSDFVQNLKRLRGAADSSVSPDLRNTVRRLLSDLIDGYGAYFTATGNSSVISMAARSLLPPRVDGVTDLGGWYGLVGAGLLGHEIAHPLDFLAYDGRYKQDMAQFAAEQWRGQLEIRANAHFFDDYFGALIAYDAFEQVMQGQPRRPIEGFTPEQRFFIGAAQSVLGGALTTESISASHSATRWRIYTNGALSAMPAFARAFGCKAGCPMAGGHVWYRAPWDGIALTSEERQARYNEYYADHYTEVKRRFFLGENDLTVQGNGIALTDAQSSTFSQLAAVKHAAEWTALADSLKTVTDNAAGNRRILRSIARQLADFRSQLELTPAQRERFDLLLQEWMAQYLPGD